MSRRISILFVSLSVASCTRTAPTAQTDPAVGSVLRVCADPNNLPFSNGRMEGFENRIAELLAQEWRMPVKYTWRAQRRGFIRHTLNARVCDIVMGVPAGFEPALTTAPYYRSTYVIVYRRNAGFNIDSLDSPLLHKLQVGVQLVGDDGNNSPPAHALARRGVIQNVHGFRVAGDYSEENPPARIIDAVARGDIDVAAAWGPMAGFFARMQPVPLQVVPLQADKQNPQLPFTFEIAMGVRHGEHRLKHKIEQVLARRKADIDRILESYGVPRL